MKLTPAQRYALRAFEGRRGMYPPRLPRTTADVLVRLGLLEPYRLSADEYWTRDAVLVLTDEGLALARAEDREWRGRQGVQQMRARALLEASKARRVYPEVEVGAEVGERGDTLDLVAVHQRTGQPIRCILSLYGWQTSPDELVRENVWLMARVLTEIQEEGEEE